MVNGLLLILGATIEIGNIAWNNYLPVNPQLRIIHIILEAHQVKMAGTDSF